MTMQWHWHRSWPQAVCIAEAFAFYAKDHAMAGKRAAGFIALAAWCGLALERFRRACTNLPALAFVVYWTWQSRPSVFVASRLLAVFKYLYGKTCAAGF